MTRKFVVLFIAAVSIGLRVPLLFGQERVSTANQMKAADKTTTPPQTQSVLSPAVSPAPTVSLASTTVKIGGGDLLEVNVYTVYGAPDVTQKTRVSSTGNVSLPFVGDVHVAGLTAEQAEDAIEKSFRDGQFMNNPHVSVLIDEYATQGISIMGEVNKPAVYPVVAPRRLLDMLSEAGGLTARAGRNAIVTHRDSPNQSQTINLTEVSKPGGANIEIQPGDTIVIPPTGIVYVIGNVGKPGGFTMDNNESITVMQAIALAEGVKAPASLDRSRIIRKKSDGSTQEVPIQLSKVLSAKSPDVALTAGDVLFIPNSAPKSAARRTAEAVLSAATGSVIYHPPW
jgi:polysaccharide export outer membrane protein